MDHDDLSHLVSVSTVVRKVTIRETVQGHDSDDRPHRSATKKHRIIDQHRPIWD